MKFSMKRSMTIARREFLTTVKRRAFLFTVIFLPAYFAFIFGVTGKFASDEMRRNVRETDKVGVVDASGAFANAPRFIRTQLEENKQDGDVKVLAPQQQKQQEQARRLTTYSAQVVFYPDTEAATSALRARQIRQLLVVPADFLASGRLQRYKLRESVFGSSDERMFTRWVSEALLVGRADSTLTDRIVRPNRNMELFTLERANDQFVKFDDQKEMLSVFFPLVIVGLLGTAIITGGQYLLQGVSEERESRILESLLATVSTDDIMVGKLIGLGGAGLALVATWTAVATYFGGPLLAVANMHVPPVLFVSGILYFLLGYLFYASIMTAIGAITNNLREAQQFAMAFTFSVFLPFVVMWIILERPEGAVATIMSLFPMTAPTTMMMRLATGYAVPMWQLGLSLALLAGAAWLALKAGSRVFRVGLLLYGKTPNLPEILKWVSSRG